MRRWGMPKKPPGRVPPRRQPAWRLCGRAHPIVNLLWLTAKEAYARADLAGAAICARLALLLRHASAYAL